MIMQLLIEAIGYRSDNPLPDRPLGQRVTLPNVDGEYLAWERPIIVEIYPPEGKRLIALTSEVFVGHQRERQDRTTYYGAIRRLIPLSAENNSGAVDLSSYERLKVTL